MMGRHVMLTVNFASRDYRLAARVYAGLIALGGLLVLIAAVLIWMATATRANIADMDRKVAELVKSEEKTKPVLLEREQLVKDLTAMSVLMEARRFSWTRLLTSVESVFPVGVALKSVDYNPKERLITLDGMAHSPEALTALIIGLGRSKSFRDPLLKHQSIDKGSISFDVGVFYQDVPAAVAHKK